ncbi:hypothetical protein R3P38DRAFT_2792414 [Favolaschia claudopus]|uniref:Uncharacterized protein n=1 Tax=Favolaschia claudopus TaxID=2862362 RepID=A0AAW0AE57_9AGAR
MSIDIQSFFSVRSPRPNPRPPYPPQKFPDHARSSGHKSIAQTLPHASHEYQKQEISPRSRDAAGTDVNEGRVGAGYIKAGSRFPSALSIASTFPACRCVCARNVSSRSRFSFDYARATHEAFLPRCEIDNQYTRYEDVWCAWRSRDLEWGSVWRTRDRCGGGGGGGGGCRCGEEEVNDGVLRELGGRRWDFPLRYTEHTGLESRTDDWRKEESGGKCWRKRSTAVSLRAQGGKVGGREEVWQRRRSWGGASQVSKRELSRRILGKSISTAPNNGPNSSYQSSLASRMYIRCKELDQEIDASAIAVFHTRHIGIFLLWDSPAAAADDLYRSATSAGGYGFAISSFSPNSERSRRTPQDPPYANVGLQPSFSSAYTTFLRPILRLESLLSQQASQVHFMVKIGYPGMPFLTFLLAATGGALEWSGVGGVKDAGRRTAQRRRDEGHRRGWVDRSEGRQLTWCISAWRLRYPPSAFRERAAEHVAVNPIAVTEAARTWCSADERRDRGEDAQDQSGTAGGPRMRPKGREGILHARRGPTDAPFSDPSCRLFGAQIWCSTSAFHRCGSVPVIWSLLIPYEFTAAVSLERCIPPQVSIALEVLANDYSVIARQLHEWGSDDQVIE